MNKKDDLIMLLKEIIGQIEEKANEIKQLIKEAGIIRKGKLTNKQCIAAWKGQR